MGGTVMKGKSFMKRLCVILTAVMMIVSVAACGRENAPADTEDEESGESSSRDDDSEDTDPEDEESPVRIIVVGDDTVGVFISDKSCKKVFAEPGDDESEQSLKLYNEDGSVQFDFSSFSAYCLIGASKNSAGTPVSCGYEENYVTENTYFVSFTYEGLTSFFDTDSKWTFSSFNNSNGKEKEIAVIKGGDMICEAGFEEYADLIGEFMELPDPVCDWEGKYMSDGYGDVEGIADIAVTEHNALIFHCTFDGETYDYIGYEKILTDVSGGLYANAKLINGYSEYGDTTEKVSFMYSGDDAYGSGELSEELTYCLDRYNTSSGDHIYAWLNKWHHPYMAPEGFADEDPNGLLGRTDPEDETYFMPASDDYVLTFNRAYEYGYTDSLTDQYVLYSYDVNGHGIDRRYKFVFESEELAEEYYEGAKPTGSDADVRFMERCGNIIYGWENPDYMLKYFLGSSKSELFLGYHYGYAGCRYWYKWKDDDGVYTSQTYMSKPYTEEQFSLTEEDIEFWQGIEKGYHPDLDVPDAGIFTNFAADGLYLSFYGSFDDEDNWLEMGETHITGQNVVTSCFSYTWRGGEYVNLLVFNEITFTEDEAKITSYQFYLDDPADTSINFDNFKKKTPDKIFTHVYDLTVTYEDY